jgi:type II secretory pathway pseudopilin PulG
VKAEGFRIRRLEGCSLIETLIAMSVLSINLMGALSMFTLSQAGITEGAKSLETVALAETKIEVLRSMPYRALLAPDLSSDGGADLVLQEGGSGEFTARQMVKGTRLSWSVIPDGPVLNESRAATIKIKAVWVDARGQHRTIHFAMRRANPVYTGGAL